MPRGLDNKPYSEASDDIYRDLISDLEIIRMEATEEQEEGLDLAIELIKDRRNDLYG